MWEVGHCRLSQGAEGTAGSLAAGELSGDLRVAGS